MRKNFLDCLLRIGKQPSSSQVEDPQRENARQDEQIRSLEKRVALAEEQNRRLKQKLDEAPYHAPGIRRLDVDGMNQFFAGKAKCYEEDGLIILRNVLTYQRAGELPVELCYPANLHFDQLSQVIKIIYPQVYEELIQLFSTYEEDVSEGSFLPCIIEGARNESGQIVARRLTLAPPESGHFVYVSNNRVSVVELTLSAYLKRLEEYFERKEESLDETRLEEASAFFKAAMQRVCNAWHKLFPGVVFLDQSEEDKADSTDERID